MNSNENSKTVWFLAAAAVVVAVAWLTRPVAAIKNEAAVLGKKLFPDFTDPAAVDSLQVLQFDQAKGDPAVLEVAKHERPVGDSFARQVSGRRQGPSGRGRQLADRSDDSSAWPPASMRARRPWTRPPCARPTIALGSSIPIRKTSSPATTGVGTRVTMKDAAGHQLASAIIGKPVPDQTDLYYVRIADKDPVYIVKLDAGKLSVRFEDWIEPNLLNLNTMDLKKVEIKDYSVTPMADPEQRPDANCAGEDSQGRVRLGCARRGISPGNSSRTWPLTRRRRTWFPGRWRPTRK